MKRRSALGAGLSVLPAALSATWSGAWAGTSEAAFAAPSAPSAPVAPGPVDRRLRLQGIEFHVACRNDASLNLLQIVPKGLALDNSPLSREVDGSVTAVDVADLDGDGSPELYVQVTSAGSGSYGTLVAYSANRRKSLSEIHLPAMDEHPGAAAEGYAGHDRFSLGRSVLVRRFPVYRPGDAQAAPTGGVRELHYRLVRGEASWRLQLTRVLARAAPTAR